ncbi:hypothetical protein BV25DRAFT_1840611 [Artomyces pyxidatus]|uniref:Uncharacterized protein n=1 Tax=Artomyces pyxidatus TaxID=48021 RepID=A0ACB8SR04_9AGAM|nr:hypothetical protein BV25DRAFT_1840611 [Artomyces pyxidatus]
MSSDLQFADSEAFEPVRTENDFLPAPETPQRCSSHSRHPWFAISWPSLGLFSGFSLSSDVLMPLASTSDNNPALLALAHRALPLTNTEDTQILSYGQVASTMLVSYDVLLTLSDEVKYIWRTKPWHLTSVLYLGARYLPCITELALLSINLNGVTGLERSRDTCRAWIYVQGVMLQLIVTVVDAVLLIRVRALYYDSKKLIAVLVVLFAVETVGLCIILGNVEPTISVDTHCFVTDVSVLLPVYCINTACMPCYKLPAWGLVGGPSTSGGTPRTNDHRASVDRCHRKPWHLTSVLYLGARYLPCITQLALLNINLNAVTGVEWSAGTCREWVYVQGVMLQLIVTAVDAVLLTRVRALYYDSKPLCAVLLALFVVEVIALIISLAFETLLFSLTLFKFAVAVRAGWGRRPVMKQFVTDGTWAFALIFLTMLVNALMFPLAHTPLAGICFTWLLSVLSIAGSRLLLNPRRMLGDGETVDTMDVELTELDFVEM